MDRERGGRFTFEQRRAAADREQLAPRRGRFLVAARTAQHEGERSERLDSDWIVGGARRAAAFDRAAEGDSRALLARASRVDVAEPERLARIARRLGAAARQVQQARGERRQREQIEAVV